MPLFLGISTLYGQTVNQQVYVSTIAGSGKAAFANGTGTGASFYYPDGVAVDTSGSVYVGDTVNNRIRKVTPGGVVSTLAGNGSAIFADGNGTGASFNSPRGVAVDTSGNCYIADTDNNRIRKVTPGGLVSTLAGSGSRTFADGNGAGASFSGPAGVAVDNSGFVYVADSNNYRIRIISSGCPAGTECFSTLSPLPCPIGTPCKNCTSVRFFVSERPP